MFETLKYDRKHGTIRQIYLVININHVQRFREVLHNAEIFTPFLPTTRRNNIPFFVYGPM